MERHDSGFGPHQSIVKALKEYKNAEIDFLADVVGRSPAEVERHVGTLEDQGVVHREGDAVTLAQSG